MSYPDLSPIAVVPYNKDYVVDFIRYKTDWDQRSEVFDKAQISYLDQYLLVNGTPAQTIVVENEYIDRHYLEDYAEYYARCFPDHPKLCSRLHFFAYDFKEHEFMESLANPSSPLIQELHKNYIGFVVIRPMPSGRGTRRDQRGIYS